MPEEKVASDKRAGTFLALERPFFRVCAMRVSEVSVTYGLYLRDRSCLLLCSLLLKALLQNWHLYFFSGAPAALFAGAGETEESSGMSARVAAGMARAQRDWVEQSV